MELKRFSAFSFSAFSFLLIVPYGIETIYIKSFSSIPVSLLIVPYGIETMKELINQFDLFAFNRTLWN